MCECVRLQKHILYGCCCVFLFHLHSLLLCCIHHRYVYGTSLSRLFASTCDFPGTVSCSVVIRAELPRWHPIARSQCTQYVRSKNTRRTTQTDMHTCLIKFSLAGGTASLIVEHVLNLYSHAYAHSHQPPLFSLLQCAYWVKQAVKVPVIAKLPLQTHREDIEQLAEAARKGGADGVTVQGTVSGWAGWDSDGQPSGGGVGDQHRMVYGEITGAWSER